MRNAAVDRIRTRAELRRRGEYLGRHLGKSLCFLQDDQSVANAPGATVRADINANLQALVTLSSGAAAPGTTWAYQLWADTTNGLLKQRNAANSGWLARGTLAETFVLARSSNTIVGLGDFGRTLNCTSSFTQTLTAAATLGDGFVFGIRNSGTGVITIDPNAAETIDGASTLVLNPGEACVVWCNGASFITVGRGWAQGSHALVDNMTFSASVGSNALTIALKTRNGNDPTAANPIRIPIRSVTAANGDYTEMLVTAASSIVVSSGSTLGTTNSTAFRVWVVAFNDGGTFRLGVINCLSGTSIFPLKGWGIASSTAEGGAGAADSAHVFYTGTAVASKPYIVLGYVSYESGLGTAGTWASVPTRAQLLGDGGPLPGDRVQAAHNATGSMSTGTTVLPFDNTTPQNTEGDQFLSQAITPSSAANQIKIEACLVAAASVLGTTMTTALFQDSTANALASVATSHAANYLHTVRLCHRLLAAGSSSTTFKIRAGTDASGTITVNGQSAAAKLNGTFVSYIEVEEIMA